MPRYRRRSFYFVTEPLPLIVRRQDGSLQHSLSIVRAYASEAERQAYMDTPPVTPLKVAGPIKSAMKDFTLIRCMECAKASGVADPKTDDMTHCVTPEEWGPHCYENHRNGR